MENVTITKDGYESFHKPGNSTVIGHDFFEGVFSYESLTPTTVITYVFGLLIGVLGPWSIIWYEINCSNRFRTILNQLFARASWYVIVNTIFVMIPEGVRFFYGPYGKIFCDLLFFLKNILWSGILLTLDTILILRYIFIFTKKNFAVINDDVLARIFNLSVLFVATWASIVKRFTPGQFPINYYLCCGKDPNEGNHDNSSDDTFQKYNTGRFIVITSILLHVMAILRIAYYQLINASNEKPHQLGIMGVEAQNEVIHSPNTSRKHLSETESMTKNKTIFDLLTQITSIFAFAIIGITIIISEGVEPKKFNLPEYKYIPFTMQLYGPVIGYIAVHIILFTRNGAMRDRIWRKITSICRKNMIGISE